MLVVLLCCSCVGVDVMLCVVVRVVCVRILFVSCVQCVPALLYYCSCVVVDFVLFVFVCVVCARLFISCLS